MERAKEGKGTEEEGKGRKGKREGMEIELMREFASLTSGGHKSRLLRRI